MDKVHFGKLLDNFESLTPEMWEELRLERDRYPFCVPIQVMLLLADKANGAALWEKQSLPRVRLYFQDVQRLYEHLDGVSSPQSRYASQSHGQNKQETGEPSVIGDESVRQDPTSEQDCEATPQQDVADESPFDVLQAINSYQEVSFKTAPRSVILSSFLEKDGGISLSDEGFEAVPVSELAENSLRTDDTLESETLALVLEKQGKLDKALAMYEKLMVNNPEKSSTFADRIIALRARLNIE